MYARIFPAQELGLLALALSLLALCSILAMAGMDNSAHRWYWETQDTQDHRTTLSTWFWSQLVVSLGVSFVVVLVVAVLHWLGWLGPLELTLYLWLAALIPLRGVIAVINNWFRMQRKPMAVLAFNLGLMLLIIGATLYLLLIQKRGLPGVFEAQVYANLVVIGIAALGQWRWIALGHFSWPRLREMLHYALPLVPAGLAGWTLMLSDRWLVELYLGKDQVALYQMAAILAMAVGFPVAAFQQAWGPFALSIHQRPEATQTYALIARVFTLGGVVLAIIVGLLAPEVAALLFSAQYREAGSSVLFLAFAQVLLGLYYIAAIGCNIVKQTAPIAAALFLGAGVQITGNVVLLPMIGRDGAALAALLAQLVMVGFLFFRAQRLYFIPYRLVETSVLLLGGFGIGWGVRHLPGEFQIGVVSCGVLLGGPALLAWWLSRRRNAS